MNVLIESNCLCADAPVQEAAAVLNTCCNPAGNRPVARCWHWGVRILGRKATPTFVSLLILY